jgi:hypothetical protein
VSARPAEISVPPSGGVPSQSGSVASAGPTRKTVMFHLSSHTEPVSPGASGSQDSTATATPAYAKRRSNTYPTPEPPATPEIVFSPGSTVPTAVGASPPLQFEPAASPFAAFAGFKRSASSLFGSPLSVTAPRDNSHSEPDGSLFTQTYDDGSLPDPALKRRRLAFPISLS